MPTPTMLWKLRDNLSLLVEGTRDHSNAEWGALMDAIEARMKAHSRDVRVLVLTEGAGPNAIQRQMSMKAGFENNPSPIAVVSRSMIVRGIITAFSWFNTNIRAFTMDRAEEAYAFLKMTPAEIDWARDETRRMRGELGLNDRAATSSPS